MTMARRFPVDSRSRWMVLAILVIPFGASFPAIAGAQVFGWRNAPAWPGGPAKPVANRNAGAAFGGVAGGLIGAAIGSDSDKTLEGALIGGLTGAVAGGMAGNQADRASFEQSQYQYQAANQAYRQAVRTSVGFGDVIQMSQSGLPDDVIARQIESQGLASRPTTADLIMLKNNGVSDRVLAAMQSAWIPTDGSQPAAVIPQTRYSGPGPQTVIVETWHAPPVYVAPAPWYYAAPGCHHHGYYHR